MSDQQEISFEPAELLGAESLPDAPASAQVEPAGHPDAMPEGPLKRLMDSNFIRYASYVIRDRAIPALDDGLKPVQRRILHSLHENDDGKFIKVANIVGYCMQFHPHGDASIADALVTLANKPCLIEGQGNFGNPYTGDPAAASRYIECRLTDLAREVIFNDDLTEFVPSYDGRKEEPLVLPVKIPLLLILGAEGIAVGLSTRILPHNFGELLEAQIAILHKQPFRIYPDFRQGGLMDVSEYDSGKGCVQLRARVEKKDAQALVIREIPFGSTTDSIIASIEEAASRGKIKIRAINDFTAENVEIEILLQPEQDADKAVDSLYAFTQCQMQIASRIMVICGNKPVEMDIPEVLRHNTDRLLEILRKELKHEQKKLAEELHRKTLVQVFIENRIYKCIEECRSQDEVEERVRNGVEAFRSLLVRDITNADIEMLLGIPIRRISLFDLEKNTAEMLKIKEDTGNVEKNLANLVAHATRYLRNLIKKYGAAIPRRTQITTFGEIQVRELTATELKISYDQEKGYVGSGIEGVLMVECSSYDKILLAWNDGRYKVVVPPEKMFVDAGLIHCSVARKDQVILVVYTEEGFTCIKKISGGSILNREYRAAAAGATVRFFSDSVPPVLYVRYVPAAGQLISQQEFSTAGLSFRDRDSRGVMMTSKPVEYIGCVKPADWKDELTGPKGLFMNML